LVNSELDLYQKFIELYKSSDVSQTNDLNSQILDKLELLLKDPLSLVIILIPSMDGEDLFPRQETADYYLEYPAVNGTHTYYGFIQYYPKKGKPCLVSGSTTGRKRSHSRNLKSSALKNGGEPFIMWY